MEPKVFLSGCRSRGLGSPDRADAVPGVMMPPVTLASKGNMMAKRLPQCHGTGRYWFEGKRMNENKHLFWKEF
jgi:hypothetical protein